MPKRLLKTSSGFILLSVAASALNFAFYPVVSHLLTLPQFGDVQLGVSFIMLAAALFTSLGTLALFVNARQESKSETINHIEHFVILISLIFAVLVAVFAVPLGSMLRLEDSNIFYFLAVIFLLNIPAATWIGALQGNGQFFASGWVSVLSASTKVLSAVIFILLGLGAYGALIGIAVGTFLMLPLVKLFHTKQSLTFKATFALLNKNDLRFLRTNPLVLFALTALILFAITASLDIFFAKTILYADEAGAFAQLSTSAKIPYFIALPIAIILFERFARNPQTVSFKTSFTFGCFVFALFLAVWLARDLILRVVFNYSGNNIDSAFPFLLGAFSIYSIITLYMYQFLAKHRIYTAFFFSLLMTAVTYCALLLAPQTIIGLSTNYFFALLVALFAVMIFTYTMRQHE